MELEDTSINSNKLCTSNSTRKKLSSLSICRLNMQTHNKTSMNCFKFINLTYMSVVAMEFGEAIKFTSWTVKQDTHTKCVSHISQWWTIMNVKGYLVWSSMLWCLMIKKIRVKVSMGIKHVKNANKIKERKFCDLCIKLTWDMFRLTYFTRDPCPDSHYAPKQRSWSW